MISLEITFKVMAAVFDCHYDRDVVDAKEMMTGDNFNV